jgi:hypothetical protein
VFITGERFLAFPRGPLRKKNSLSGETITRIKSSVGRFLLMRLAEPKGQVLGEGEKINYEM